MQPSEVLKEIVTGCGADLEALQTHAIHLSKIVFTSSPARHLGGAQPDECQPAVEVNPCSTQNQQACFLNTYQKAVESPTSVIRFSILVLLIDLADSMSALMFGTAECLALCSSADSSMKTKINKIEQQADFYVTCY